MNKYIQFGSILVVVGIFAWWFLKSCRETIKNTTKKKKKKDPFAYMKSQLE